MNSQQFESSMDMVAMAAGVVSVMPLDEMLKVVSSAEALSPVLFPTQYRDGGGKNLSDQRRILEAAVAFRKVVKEVRGE